MKNATETQNPPWKHKICPENMKKCYENVKSARRWGRPCWGEPKREEAAGEPRGQSHWDGFSSPALLELLGLEQLWGVRWGWCGVTVLRGTQNVPEGSSPARGFPPSRCSRGVPGRGLQPERPSEEQGQGEGNEGGSIPGLFLENVQEGQGPGRCLHEDKQPASSSAY